MLICALLYITDMVCFYIITINFKKLVFECIFNNVKIPLVKKRYNTKESASCDIIQSTQSYYTDYVHFKTSKVR